jgi:beta-lactamase regulating signal transducer with metallopeptidase domain
MSQLASSLGWLLLQVTAIVLFAWLLDAVLARRCPAAASRILAVAFAAVAILTLLSFGPLPAWWTWQRSPARSVASDRPAQTSEPLAESAVQASAPPPRVAFKLNLPESVPSAAPARKSFTAAWRWLPVAWLAGVALALVRLTVALAHTGRIWRRSRAIDDLLPNQLLADLSTRMGCGRRVELREADLAGLPATAGWLRPFIFLPPDWRTWGESEMRVALVHELAHICAADYLTNIIGKLV